MRWIPLAMAKEGITPVLLDVLLDVESDARLVPLPGHSVVYDRDGYATGRNLGLLSWKQAHPVVSSLADDRFVLTQRGRDVITTYREAVRALGAPSRG